MTLIEQVPGSSTGDSGDNASSTRADTGSTETPVLEATRLAGFSEATAWSRLNQADSTEAFAAAWIDLQCRLIGGVRAAVVVFGPNDDGAYVPLTYWPEGSTGTQALTAVAELSMAQRRGAVHQPQTEKASAPLDALAYPIMLGQELRGVVAIEVVRESDARLRGVMRLLQWGCAWWHHRRLGLETAPSASLTAVLELLATGLQEKRFLDAATATVTELSTTLHCERVSFGIRRGRHTQLRALSHTANFNKKSGLIRALCAAMDEAIDQQETLVLPRSEQAVPLVTRGHGQLMEQHGSRHVCTIPLSDGGCIIGALTLERGYDQPFTTDEIRLCEHAGTLIGPMLEAKRREDRWITAKVWDSVRGFAGNLLGGGHLVLKTTALALSALVLFFVFATGDYRITAPAALEGTVQRAISAPQDGYITDTQVRAGDLVSEHQPLAALEDKDLRLEKIQWEGQREKYLREYSKALAENDRARVRILGAQAEQAEARIALLTEQLARTRINAPFAGVVVSGDLSQSLGAPVSRGDVLFEIAPLDSYRVILKVDERDISQLQVGQAGALALAGLPGETLMVRVEKITPVSSTEEGRNLFRVEADLESPSGALRPGMNGIAKIYVDQRNLFWIWTHKLTYWLRFWWWSWWS